MTDTLEDRIGRIHRIRDAWLSDEDQIASRTVAATAAAGDLPVPVVERQLRETFERAVPGAMVERIREHHGSVDVLESAPDRILHLLAGNVPGLAIESLMWGLLTPASHEVPVSRVDPSSRPVCELASELGADVAAIGEPDWTSTGAIVMGSDATVELVRTRLGDVPITEFGDRTSAAVIEAGRFAEVVDFIVDDVARFAQRGCMSPRTVILVGASADDRATAREQFTTRLAAYLQAEGYLARPAIARSAADDAALDLVATTPGQLHMGPVSLRLATASSAADLAAEFPPPSPPLSTVVFAADRDDVAVAEWAAAGGATRIVTPGAAHELETAHWHEGIGHLGGLLAPN